MSSAHVANGEHAAFQLRLSAMLFAHNLFAAGPLETRTADLPTDVRRRQGASARRHVDSTVNRRTPPVD
jgi:hypothetical protein